VAHDHPELSGSASARVWLLRGTSILMVEARGTHPEYTARYLNALLDQYIEARRDRRLETTFSAMQQIREELPRVEAQLARQEDELYRFKEQHNMGFWGRQSNDASQLLSQLKLREANLRMQLNLAEAMQAGAITRDRESRLSAMAALDGTAVPAAPTTDLRTSQQVQALRQELIKLQVEREQLQLIFKPKHPRMVRLEQDIQRQSRLIELLTEEGEQAYRQTLVALRGEYDSVKQAIVEWERRALESARTEAEYEKLETALERTRELYARLLAGLQSMDVGRGVSVDIVQILQRATPAQPVRPALKDAVKRGGGMGLLLGGLLLVGLARLDQRAHDVAEILAAVDAPAAVEIPLLPGGKPSVDVATGGMHRYLKEAMRRLVATWPRGIGGAESATKVIFCVSTTPGEGKSTVALHLALHAASTGLRTLLIDADLRRGHLHTSLQRPAEAPGLVEVMESEADEPWVGLVHEFPGLPLSFLGRGRDSSDGVDWLGAWFEKHLPRLRSAYDLVVIDAAPLAPVADSQRLLALMDQVVMVTRIKQTPLGLAGKIAALIRQYGGNSFSLIINGSSPQHSQYYHDYYGYY
jgi:polysaccharide biosynthesis transport protein